MRAVRHASVAGRGRLGRDPRRARRPRLGVGSAASKDEFEIPGSDTQKGDRPDRVRVRVRAGRGAEPRLRRARGRTLDTPERRAAIEDAIAKLQTRRVRADRRTRPGSRASATRSARTRSPTTAASPTRRRSSTRRSRRRIARRSSPSRTPSARRSSPPASPPSSTATPSSRRSSRGRRSCSACSRRSSCC